MTKLPLFLIIVFLLGSAASAAASEAEDYSNTISMFRNIPTVEKFFDNCYGYAVFPTIGKAGYVIGGSYGEGQVYKQGLATGKSTVIEGSIGFQFGGQAFSEIIFFQDRAAYDKFISGDLEFGATVQAVAVTAGAGAKVGTTGASAGVSAGPRTEVQAEVGYINGMAIFVHPSGGLMVDISVGGQKFTYTPL